MSSRLLVTRLLRGPASLSSATPALASAPSTAHTPTGSRGQHRQGAGGGGGHEGTRWGRVLTGAVGAAVGVATVAHLTDDTKIVLKAKELEPAEQEVLDKENRQE